MAHLYNLFFEASDSNAIIIRKEYGGRRTDRYLINDQNVAQNSESSAICEQSDKYSHHKIYNICHLATFWLLFLQTVLYFVHFCNSFCALFLDQKKKRKESKTSESQFYLRPLFTVFSQNATQLCFRK